MRTKQLVLSLIALNAGACGSKVVVGDLGGSGAGSSSGGASQVESGGNAVGGAGFGSVDFPTANAGSNEVVGVAGSASQPCASALDQPLPAVVTACPDAMPDIGSACDEQAENSVCVWPIDYLATNSRGFRALGCYAGSNGKFWSGDEEQQTEPFLAVDSNCPKQAPVLGSDCPTIDSKSDGETCIYPSWYCECSSVLTGHWLCTDGLVAKSKTAPPVVVQGLCTPAGFDETEQVQDLAMNPAPWCAWNAQASGTMVALSGKDSPGVADSYQFHTLQTADQSLCLADLPANLCAMNLKTLGAKCTATVGELDDCMETIRAAATGGWVGHGCAPLLSNPTCAGVVVQQFKDNDAQCVVPLE